MTIAIACNLADGLVLGADSAVTIMDNTGGILKVYNDAEKLFPLYDLPIGMVTYGAGSLMQRTIRSHVREFEAISDRDVIANSSIGEVAQLIWQHLHGVYATAYQAETGVAVGTVPVEQRPVLGLLMGGFGAREWLSEVWELNVQFDDPSTGAVATQPRGLFGAAWRGQTDGVTRFHKGFDFPALERILRAVETHTGAPLAPAIIQEVQKILGETEYTVPFDSMPLQEGVDYVRFMLDVMVSQTRFVVGAPTCGGRVRIAVIEGGCMEWVTATPFTTSH